MGTASHVSMSIFLNSITLVVIIAVIACVISYAFGADRERKAANRERSIREAEEESRRRSKHDVEDDRVDELEANLARAMRDLTNKIDETRRLTAELASLRPNRTPILSPEDVARIHVYQSANRWHPLTCGNRGDGKHLSLSERDIGILVPTIYGLICPFCDYKQEWIPDAINIAAPKF